MWLYCFFYVIICGATILSLVLNDYNLYDCLLISTLNILIYPVFNMCLTMETILSRPFVKHLSYDNFNNLGKRDYIIYECKKLIKYNTFWLFLVILPFVISLLINQSIFINFTILHFFIIVSLAYLIIHLWVLSAMVKNFYKPHYYLLIVLSGLIFSFYLAFVPQEDMALLSLICGLLVITYLVGILLIKGQHQKIKRKE